MSRLLTAEDVVELAKSLRDLPEERVAEMRALLCPGAADQELGVEDSLRYYIVSMIQCSLSVKVVFCSRSD